MLRDLPLQRLEHTERPRVEPLPLDLPSSVTQHRHPLVRSRGLRRDRTGHRGRWSGGCFRQRPQLRLHGLPFLLEPLALLTVERGGPEWRLHRLPLRRDRARRVPRQRLTGL
ncbi:hypothetical protein DM785_17175 (plasmid) [Deinococcus actinosclerus]|nr:hypothetical protein DM785_17175 [Deinococcus actinosclerus]